MTQKKLLTPILLLIFIGYNSVFSQGAFPLRGIFYYAWYPETWVVNGAHVFYQPDLGYYSSDDQTVVDQHVQDLKYANIDVAIVSWWGINQHSESTRFPLLMSRTTAAGSNLKWAIYYEKEGTGNPSVAEIQSDLAYVMQNYVPNPAYAKINGKPVVFVYNADDTSCEVADRWAQATNGQWYVSLKVVGGYQGCTNQPSTWHQYGPNAAEQEFKGYSFVIAPGFWRADEASPLLTRDPNRWSQNVLDMVKSAEPWQLITTFNEWGEGTAIEGAKDWTSTTGYGVYLDALHNNGSSTSIINQYPDVPGKNNLSMSQNTEFNIYDLKGKLIKTLKNKTFNDYGIDINANVLPQGVYLLELKTEKNGSLSEQIKIAYLP